MKARYYFSITILLILFLAIPHPALSHIPSGDVAPLGNRDGEVDVGDALLALRFALDLEPGHPTADELSYGDVAPLDDNDQPNPDGQITVGDALVILRKALGLANWPCTDADSDGYYAESGCETGLDCNDNDASINPGATEVCDDGKDNDCDGLTDCADMDCEGDPVCQPTSTITGDAAKGPINGGTIQLFYFDSNGDEVEIIAENDPVTTDSAGAYSFEIDPANLEGITSPLIVRITGGATDGQSAPQLEAVIADPSTLSTGGSSVTTHLSVASSVAAGLLKKVAATGIAPTTADANTYMARVENELDVDLTEDPATAGTDVAYINDLVDLNLDLPDNNNAVDDLIDYLVANLSSTFGALDNNMDDSANPGTDIAAAFSGELATLLSGGPSDFRILSFAADKTSVGNNGTDAAALTATLEDINGNAVADETINLTESLGNVTFSDASPITSSSGQAQASITSTAAAGTATVYASHTLPNGNALSEHITFTISGCQDIAGVTVASDKSSVIADGADAATITATVSAVCTGSTVPEGTEVNFAVTSGTADLSAASSSTTNGQASVTLTGTQVSAVTVEVSVTNAGGTAFTDSVDITLIADPCDPAAPTVTPDTPSIVVGETYTITANVPVADPANCAEGVADGTVVIFTVVYGDVKIQGDGVTITTDGKAAATLEVGFCFDDIIGNDFLVTATVTDSQGNSHSGTLWKIVWFDLCAPYWIAVTANPTVIGAGGTSTITADVWADPMTCTAGVANGTTVTFSATGGGTVSPAQATTTNGVATTTLTAPSSVGTVKVTASADSILDTVDVCVASLPTSSAVTVNLTEVHDFALLIFKSKWLSRGSPKYSMWTRTTSPERGSGDGQRFPLLLGYR
jgi:hypothetical protein